jgi:hypothetical protein
MAHSTSKSESKRLSFLAELARARDVAVERVCTAKRRALGACGIDSGKRRTVEEWGDYSCELADVTYEIAHTQEDLNNAHTEAACFYFKDTLEKLKDKARRLQDKLRLLNKLMDKIVEDED